MKRLDRAMFAIFLLALLADVARAHSAIPAGDDAGFLLSAASQLQVGPADGTLLEFRKPIASSLPTATLDRFALTFSGWSIKLFSQAILPSRYGSIADGDRSRVSLPAFQSNSSLPENFEHQGSPAP
jgi:hypothetical protein